MEAIIAVVILFIFGVVIVACAAVGPINVDKSNFFKTELKKEKDQC